MLVYPQNWGLISNQSMLQVIFKNKFSLPAYLILIDMLEVYGRRVLKNC